MLNFKANANGYVQPRKITASNLETLFGTLMHIVQLSSVQYKGQLIGMIGIIYNRILYMYSLDPRSCIANLKLVRAWWITIVREGVSVNPDTSVDSLLPWSDEHNCPELVVGLVPLWNEWVEKYTWETAFVGAQVIFSLLSSDRVIVLPLVHNHSSITDPGTGQDHVITQDEIRQALESMGMTSELFIEQLITSAKNFEFEILNSKGPNGDQAWSAHLDARAWSRCPSFMRRFISFNEIQRTQRIIDSLIGCVRVPEAEPIPLVNPKLGKLAYIEEWGGKSRIVAQLDYFTQMAMTPLHNTINHFLRTLSSDGTFNQDAIASQVRQWTRDDSNTLYSYDLTAATDRIPIDVQTSILEILTENASYAKSWERLLVGRFFVTNNGDTIQYAVGQPMGARSSFPMLALTHHVLVRIAAAKAGLKDFRDYVILGDDSTMLGSNVATQYVEIMTKLGVVINRSKSVVNISNARCAAEICKRVFISGLELSAINPKLIVSAANDGRLGPDLQNDLLRRGFNISSTNFWTLMASILDKDNLVMLLRLNLMPKTVSGLHTHMPVESPLKDYNAWIPPIRLTARDFCEMMTYITATEGLKRLDAVLRMSSSIMDVLRILAASNANPKAIPQNVRDVWLSEVLKENELDMMKKYLTKMGPITYSHPIVLAATAETNRISEYLHALNSADEVMVLRAREGLLDMFRSSVGAIWLQDEMPREQVSRAIFTKMLTLIISMFKKWRLSGKIDRMPSVTYSVVLTTISRLWNVHFEIGSLTTVNALKSSVTKSIHEASSTLTGAIEAMNLFPSEIHLNTPNPKLTTGAKDTESPPLKTKLNTPTLETNDLAEKN